MILSPNVSGKLSWKGALAMAILAIIALPYWSLAQSAADPPQTEASSMPELVIQESSEETAITEEVVGDIRYLHPPAIAQSLIVEEGAWGPNVDGLKAAFLMSDIVGRSDDSMFVNGALVVKNVSEEPVWFSETASTAIPKLYSVDDKRIAIETGPFLSTAIGHRFYQACSIVRRTILAPGEQCVLDRECELAVYSPDRNTRWGNSIHTVYERANVPPGRYSVAVDFTPGLQSESYWNDLVEHSKIEIALPDFYENGQVVPRSVPGEWYGSLQTGRVQLTAFDGSDATKINESRKVPADVADNLRIGSRNGLTFFKRDGVLRLYDQQVPHALVAFVPAHDGVFITEGVLKLRSTCLRNLLDISEQQVKLIDLCSGNLQGHFVPNQEGELELQDAKNAERVSNKVNPDQESTSEQNDISHTLERWVSVSPLKVTVASAGTAKVLDDYSVRLDGERVEMVVADAKFAYRWCPAGEFKMGASEDARREYGERFVPQQDVLISTGFWMQETEVTQLQYEKVMGQRPAFWNVSLQSDDISQHPVEQITWFEATEFCARLSKMDVANNYRLPTEAEWEYSCRAGTTTTRYGDLKDIAWTFQTTEEGGEGGSGHRHVGKKKPNAWGLYDMLGNVAEWCSDWHGPPPLQFIADPTGPESGESRIVRGDDCFADCSESFPGCLAGARASWRPDDSSRIIGFRVVRIPANAEKGSHIEQ